MRCRSEKQAAWLGFIFGFLYSALELEWMRSAFGNSSMAWGRYGVVWLLTSAIIGMSYSLGGLLLWLFRTQSRIPLSVSVPLVIVSSEWFADLLLRGCGGTTLDPIRLALTQVDIPATRALVEFGGTAGLGAFVGLANALMLTVANAAEFTHWSTLEEIDGQKRCTNRSNARRVSWGSGLTFLALIGLGCWRTFAATEFAFEIPVAIIADEFGRDDQILQDRLNALRPKLVVWPENASASIVRGEDCGPLHERARRLGCAILVGVTRIQESPPENWRRIGSMG